MDSNQDNNNDNNINYSCLHVQLESPIIHEANETNHAQIQRKVDEIYKLCVMSEIPKNI